MVLKKHRSFNIITYVRLTSKMLEEVDGLRAQNDLDLTRSDVIRQLVGEALRHRRKERRPTEA